MTNVELYINNQLCDIRDPQNLGIRLNRVLINPAELATKDAQYSYSITIPSSPANDAIFNYINVEEVKDKFNHKNTARVHVDGVMVFDGLFKLSEIDAGGNYKGNLVVPTTKTVKEIFGDKKMNEIGTWKFYLTKDGTETGEPMGMVEMLNKINSAEGTPDAICPLVLYGLLPKAAKDSDGNYSEKDVWDNTVRLGVEDFPPSLNCLQTIKHIFESHEYEQGKSYQITGSAFNDPKLANLYMSYSNPTDYEQPWNWAHLGKMTIEGNWYSAEDRSGKGYMFGLSDQEAIVYSNRGKMYTKKDEEIKEENLYCNTVDLFGAKNAAITVIEDNGYNVYQYETTNKQNEKIKHTSVKVPISGFYKVSLEASVELIGTWEMYKYTGSDKYIAENSCPKNGINFVYANAKLKNDTVDGKLVSRNLFHKLRAEIKVVRTRGEELDMTEQTIDGLYFRDNLKQYYDPVSQTDTEGRKKFNTYPKYFPQENSVLWIDPYKNKHFVCGLHWGKRDQVNPVDKRSRPCHAMAAKSGISWSTDNDDVNYSVANSQAYLSYKPTTTFDENAEKEEGEINVSDLGYLDEGKFEMSLTKTIKPNSIGTNYVEDNYGQGIGEVGEGNMSAVVWLDKGDQLSVLDVTDAAIWGSSARENYFVAHNTHFKLTLEPYKKSQDWATIKMDGTGIEKTSMNWKESSDFSDKYIDLTQFLPSEQKVDEWIEGFCKAFNLDLLQPEVGKFQLNTKKRSYVSAAGSVLDLSDKVDLQARNNQPLGLPSEISATFKIDKDEEGYDWQTRKDDNGNANSSVLDEGSGKLETGSLDGKPIAQTSNFSYNWYKKIDCSYFFEKENNKKYDIPFPIISNKEVWEKRSNRGDYVEMQKKTYTSYPQRFWYRGQDRYNMGALWQNRYEGSSKNFPDKYKKLSIYPVVDNSKAITGSDYLSLTYKNEPYSILRSYFTLISTDDSNYTEVECFLTPDEYDRLSSETLVSLNSDLYYVASMDGYDPVGKNKTKLKLIRKV